MYRLRPFLQHRPAAPRRDLAQPAAAAGAAAAGHGAAAWSTASSRRCTSTADGLHRRHARRSARRLRPRRLRPHRRRHVARHELGTTHVLMVERRPSTRRRSPTNCSPRARTTCAAAAPAVLYAGGINPLNSFYLGLYGGSEIPGVLQSDVVLQGGLHAAPAIARSTACGSCSATWPASARPCRASCG